MQAPTAEELLGHSVVRDALEQAWIDSRPGIPEERHEEGGWVYANVATGLIEVRRAGAGIRAVLNLNSPPVVSGSVVVATFHTHPNPRAEGWSSGPSDADTESAMLLGVPCLIRAEDGIHLTGPARRRGGLEGQPGFPR